MSKLDRILFKAGAGNIEQEDGKTVIRDVSIVTAGVARGHGVNLDQSFVAAVVDQGSQLKTGAKARFGHPSMCSEALGTYVGRFRNFRLSSGGDKAIADMYLAESAKSTPHGNLHGYIATLAEDDPEAFATSIVFRPGPVYRKDSNGDAVPEDDWDDYEGEELSEEVFATCEKLLGVDFVDEPAANPGGLFSEVHTSTIAGRVDAFFKQEPEALELLLDNPELVEIISKHGDKIVPFIAKIKEASMTSEENEHSKQEEFHENKQTETTEQEETEVESFDASEQTVVETEAQFVTIEEYRQWCRDYGQEIADTVYDSGGDEDDARDLYIEKLEAQNRELSEKVNELSDNGFSGTTFTDTDKPKKRSLTANLKI